MTKLRGSLARPLAGLHRFNLHAASAVLCCGHEVARLGLLRHCWLGVSYRRCRCPCVFRLPTHGMNLSARPAARAVQAFVLCNNFMNIRVVEPRLSLFDRLA